MIGMNIRVLRQKKNITQKDLAESMGVSRQAVCMWETGKRDLKVTTLNKMAEVFNVPVHNIIGGSIMVKKGEKKVRFEVTAPAASKVTLTGDFNAWNKSGVALKKDKSGVWSTDMSLKPGKYQYKYIVDGQWKTDPANRATVRNTYGTENSVKEVA